MAEDQTEVIKQLKIIADRLLPPDASMFGSKQIGGEDDNTDVIKAINDAGKAKALAKENEKLFNKMKKDLSIKSEIKNLNDAIKSEKNQAAALKKLSTEVLKSGKKEFASAKELNDELARLEELANKAGTSLKEAEITGFRPLRNSTQRQVLIIRDSINVGKKINKQSDKKLKVVGDIIEKQEELAEQYDKNVQKMVTFGNVVKKLGKEFLKFAETEQRYAQATATADAGWISGMVDMRISQIEYMKVLKDTRTESLAAQTAGVNFKESLAANAKELRRLTANNEDAAKGAAMFQKNVAAMGVSQGKLGDAVGEQTKIYKENYRGLGYTVEEFANLTSEIVNEQGMRSVLLGLQEDERKSYIQNTQRRIAEYHALGYSIQRAKELEKTFQALNKMNPKERMKKAAKERAMLGAMGMGSEGARLFELQTNFRTMNEEQKSAAQTEMASIRAKASKKFGSMSGAGVSQGQAASMQMLAEATGFNDIVNVFETESGKGQAFDAQQLKHTEEIDKNISGILEWVSTWEAMQNSAVGSVVTGVGKIVGTVVLGVMMKKLLPKLLPAASSAMTGAGAKAAGAVASTKGAAQAAGSVASKLTAGAAKTGVKTALKVLPGIGLIASLGFMTSRMMDGDYLGAAMELGSGLMGLAPGIGTAGAVAMQGAIVARDMSNESSTGIANDAMQSATAGTTPQTPMANSADSSSVLLGTLSNIDQYIRSTGEVNINLADSVRKLGLSIEEQTRRLSLPSNRSTW